MSGEDPNSAAAAEPADAAAQAPQAPVEQPAPVAEPLHVPAPDPAPEPTPTVGTADASFGAPAGSAAFGGATSAPVDPNPEKLVGAAFAGGLVGALFLKALAKRKHR
jgi:hypothetical protein